MLRTIVLLALLATEAWSAQNFSFILGPTVIDEGAGDPSLPPGCLDRVKSGIRVPLSSALAGRLTTLSRDKLLRDDDKILILLPTVSVMRDFREIVAGSINRHSVVLVGHLQIIDPWSNFTVGSIPTMFNAQFDVGFSQAEREGAAVSNACSQVAAEWAKEVGTKALNARIRSLDNVALVPLPKSSRRHSGAVLLAGTDQHLKDPLTFRSKLGDYFKVVDMQPSYSLVEAADDSSRRIGSPDSATITTRDGGKADKPTIGVDSHLLATVLTRIEPDARLQQTQLAGLFAGYLAKSEAIDLLMETAMDSQQQDYQNFDKDISRLSTQSLRKGDASASDRQTVIARQRDSVNLQLVLRLVSYSHKIARGSDASINHSYQMAVACDLMSTDLLPVQHQLATVFAGEVRQRIEKNGVREIDNSMTAALLTRSSLIKLAAKVEEYITSEYIPRYMRGRVAMKARVLGHKTVQWERRPAALMPIRMYHAFKSSEEEATLFRSGDSASFEFLGTTNIGDLEQQKEKSVQEGDLLTYSVPSTTARNPVAINVDVPIGTPEAASIRSALASVAQDVLSKQSHTNIEILYLNGEEWARSDSGAVSIVLSDAQSAPAEGGCTAKFIVRAWGGRTAAELATHDKTASFYKGSQFTSDPVPTGNRDTCLVGGLLQYIPTFQEGINVDGFVRHVLGNSLVR